MRRSAVIVSLLLAAASAANAQDAITLRINGQAGQSNHYRGVMETYMRPGGQMASMMSSDTTLPFMRMTMLMTRTLNDVTGDTLTFVEVIDSAAMETPAAPQMSGMMGAMAGQMRGQTTTQKVNRLGRVYSSEVTGGMTAMAGMGGPGGRGGRGGPGGMAGRSERPIFFFPERAVRVGETWSDTATTPGSSPGESPTVSESTFRLVRVDQRGGTRIAVVSVNGTQATAGPQGPQNYSVSGEFQLDLTANRLASVTMTMTGTMQGREGPTPVRMVVSQNLVP